MAVRRLKFSDINGFRNNNFSSWRLFEVGLPVVDTYAHYTADSFSGTTWQDVSGNGRNATVSRGSITLVNQSAGTGGATESFLTLQGDTGDSILFPPDVLPSTYTLFHVTRYSGGSRARIVTSGDMSVNWLSGHWGGEAGVAYHSAWLTPHNQRDPHQNNWLISMDQNNRYRGNTLLYGTGGGGTTYDRLGINTWTSELSDWQCAEVIVYNRTLSETEYSLVENYLATKYGIPVRGSFIPQDEFLFLDAANNSSYPGSGTTWFDISGNNRNFSLATQNVYTSAGPEYMRFTGSYGMAKNGSDLPLSGEVTYCAWTRPLTSTANWRTLTRSYSADHHVIIQAGGYNIGMYDNNGSGFLGTGYSQQSLPGWNTGQWNFMCWRWETSESLDYTLSINDSPNTIRGAIDDTNARYNRGFGSLGGYHNGSTNPSVGSQYWGDISQFIVYNRYITDTEALNIFNAGRQRHGV